MLLYVIRGVLCRSLILLSHRVWRRRFVLFFVKQKTAYGMRISDWGSDVCSSDLFTERADLFGRFQYALGIDGMALMLIMLSVFLMPLCILASWDAIKSRVGLYMSMFLIMEVVMIGVFMAQDLLLFYIFFEAGLIPMYFIIGIWGGANRKYEIGRAHV